jgi:hypothetical protein
LIAASWICAYLLTAAASAARESGGLGELTRCAQVYCASLVSANFSQ